MPVGTGQVSAYLLDNPTPPCLQVAGVDADGMENITFGTSKRWVILIEACLGLVSDIGAQKLLNSLLSEGAVAEAVESDQTPAGALYSRLSDDGVVTTGTTPACDSVAYLAYRGQAPTVLENGSRVLLATWAVEVLTS